MIRMKLFDVRNVEKMMAALKRQPHCRGIHQQSLSQCGHLILNSAMLMMHGSVSRDVQIDNRLPFNEEALLWKDLNCP